MSKILSSMAESAYAFLRIVAGLMFSFHGMQKILGVLSEQQPEIGTQIWFGGMIELTCGLLIAVGFLTPFAAFLASGTMAVAYAQFHWKMQLDANFFPAINKGELALLYSFVFLYIACKGAGKWSIDRSRKKARTA